MLFPEATTNVRFSCKIRLPSVHFEILIFVSQQAKKRTSLLEGVIDPNYQREIGLFLHITVKGDCIWSTGYLLGCLMVLKYPVIKVSG